MSELDNLMTILTPLLAIIIPILAIYLRKYKNIINVADKFTSKLATAVNRGVFDDNNPANKAELTKHLKNIGKISKSEYVDEFIDNVTDVHLAKSISIQHNTKSKVDVTQNKSWYYVDFQKEKLGGNSFVISENNDTLRVGSSLVESYVTAKISKIFEDGSERVLQVGQGTNIDSIFLKLRYTDGTLYRKGQYKLMVKGDYGTSDSVGVVDIFQII